MGLPSFRRNKSHSRKRRSHLALKPKKPGSCPKCAEPIRGHRACANCGTYKGRQVITTKSDVILKRDEKRKKQEQKDKEKMQSLKNK